MTRTLIILTLSLCAVLTGIVWWLQREPPPPENDFLLPLGLLDDLSSEGFAAVSGDWEFRFPRDHAAHPDFRSEAWTLAATLEDADGEQLGLQFTLLRLALSPETPEHPSAWATNELYRASLVVGDVAGDRLLAEERLSRVALELAGSDTHPPRVWLENWMLEADDTGLALSAATEDLQVALRLEPLKAPVLRPAQGRGEAAFHAYALPRLAVRGELLVQGEGREVVGLAWLDRAWGAVPISRGQQALDRFLVQLDDGRELAIFRLHRRGGGGTPIPTVLLINEDGEVREYGRREVELEPTRHWESPRDGTRYPLAWRLRLPAESLVLALEPLREAQELDMLLRYWAGSLTVSGEADGAPVQGVGYLELTGYADTVQTL